MTGKMGTGHPEPGKDRTAHEAARGAKSGKALTLSHLTKKPLTSDEFTAALAAIQTESDRGVAILGAALVEDALADAINSCLQNDEDRNALYHDVGAPFGTFRSKTVSAYALGLCDKETRDDIEIIRSIRNLFSHALRSLDFKNADVTALCQRLQEYPTDPEIYPAREAKYGPSRMRFIGACLHSSTALHRMAKKRLEAELAFDQSVAASQKSGAEDASDNVVPD